jgi:hypothetical protein
MAADIPEVTMIQFVPPGCGANALIELALPFETPS